MTVSRGAIVATLVGNTLEFYDFIVYTFLAVHIGNAFFPTDSELASLLLSVATFGLGFLTRPLGGVWIGAGAALALSACSNKEEVAAAPPPPPPGAVPGSIAADRDGDGIVDGYYTADGMYHPNAPMAPPPPPPAPTRLGERG